MNRRQEIVKRVRQVNLLGWFLRSRFAKGFIGFLQRKKFLGYQEISWYSIFEFLVRWVDTKDLHLRSSALAFTFFLSLFPTVIFFFTLIAYLPFKQSPDEILFFLQGIIPNNAFKIIRTTLMDILKHQRSGLLSIGFVLAVYFSTNGFHSLMNTLNRYGKEKETRSFWKQRMIAIILSFIVSTAILLSVLLVTGGNWAIKWLDKTRYFPSKMTPFLLFVLNNGIVVFIILSIISCIYYFAPSKHSKWRFLTPGSVFACFVTLFSTYLFSLYVNQFNAYNKVYGSIGALIVVMLLIYINTYILLLGYELNIVIEKAIMEVRKGTRFKGNTIVYLRKILSDPNDRDSH
jgi:membrane protein